MAVVFHVTQLRGHISVLLCLAAGGLVVMGPPCSSYAWCCRSTSGRRAFLQQGVPVPTTLVANIVAARTALLWFLADAMNHWILLEQPRQGSVGLFKGTRFQRLAERCRVSRLCDNYL